MTPHTHNEIPNEIRVNPKAFTEEEKTLLRVLYVSYPNYITAETIAQKSAELQSLGKGIELNARSLRGEDGLRVATSKVLHLLTGWKVIATTNGYKISCDEKEWQEAERRVVSHLASESKNVKHLREPQPQEGLFQ